MTRAGLALLLVASAAACGGAGAGGDGGSGGDGASDDGGAGVDAIWPGGNSYTGATCPCGFGEACVGETCQAAPSEYISLGDNPADRSLACAYDAGQLSNSFVPGVRVGRCQAMGGAIASPSTTITTGNVTITGTATPLTWPGAPGCNASLPPVEFVDGADVTIAVTPTETFPMASVTLRTPASPAGALLPTAIVPGEPLAFAWTPAPDVDDTVEIILVSSGPFFRVRCVDVPDTGAFKIPAELTAMMTELTSANVAVQRVAREHQTPDTLTPVSLELALVRIAQTTIPVAGNTDLPPDAAPPGP